MSPRTVLASFALAAVALSLSPAAQAEEAAPAAPSRSSHVEASEESVAARPAPAVTPSGVWYGWQTLLADGVSLGTMPLELGSRTPSASYLFYASLSGYALGAPVIHAAHGHYRLAAADVGLRAGAVVVGSLLGAAVGSPGTPTGCDARLAGCLTDRSNGMIVGATLGAVAASIVDASFLARDARPREAPPSPSFTWSPTASVMQGGASAGLVGTF